MEWALSWALHVFVVWWKKKETKGRSWLVIPVTHAAFLSSACDSTFPSLFMLAAFFPALSPYSHPFSSECQWEFKRSKTTANITKTFGLLELLHLHLFHLSFFLSSFSLLPHLSPVCSAVCIGIINTQYDGWHREAGPWRGGTLLEHTMITSITNTQTQPQAWMFYIGEAHTPAVFIYSWCKTSHAVQMTV